MTRYSLAVDIGASSGRVILGHLENSKLSLQEIHRFENQIVKKGDYYCWDVEKLFLEIKSGLVKCRELGVKPESIGIDTWAVDFVLLDEHGNLLTDAVAYRDPRTDGMLEKVFEIIPKEALYNKTGIQFQKFNTIYQLYALKQKSPDALEKAKSFLMIPDYFNFLLTGKKSNEYTNATSTQLVNAHTNTWDYGIITELGLNGEMFQEISLPNTVLGTLRDELVAEFGFDLKVVLPATHDTGSAVIAVPEVNETIYISSGTWSLIGVENETPKCDANALHYNFTNEGGIDFCYRFLKNIMGLWMIQEVRRHLGNHYSFAELMELSQRTKISSIVNVNDSRFLYPENMIEAVQQYCQETNQPIPQLPGELAACVFHSLAKSYQEAVGELEAMLEKQYKQINVIGGGCQNGLLNQLIADVTQKEVYAGPVEATAIGNLVSQFISTGQIEDINSARNIIKQSFKIEKYVPN